MGKTSIEWTDRSVNPIRARKKGTSSIGHYCEKVSSGCAFCYASRMQVRFGMPAFPSKRGNLEEVEVFFDPDRLFEVLRLNTPSKFFWCDMTDLFGHWVPDEWIDACLFVMCATERHIHQVLAKRPERAAAYFAAPDLLKRIAAAGERIGDSFQKADHIRWWRRLGESYRQMAESCFGNTWPRPNIWLGTSCEDQKTADERIPHLLKCPAAVRFLSCEPLIGTIDLYETQGIEACDCNVPACEGAGQHSAGCSIFTFPNGIHWVIVGGESGHGARPMHPVWAKSVRDRCIAAGVPFFFKQWGQLAYTSLDTEKEYASVTCITPDGVEAGYSHTNNGWWRFERQQWRLVLEPVDAYAVTKSNKHATGRELDGRTWDEMPEVSRG